MRKVVYGLLLALLLFAPLERLDVADLEPVQTVAVYTEEDTVVLETDTGSVGRGENVTQAYEDLEKNTPAAIYLDTAQYLLITEEAANYADDLRKYLKPSVRVSLFRGEIDLKNAAKYLSIHSDLPKLKNWGKNVGKDA